MATLDSVPTLPTLIRPIDSKTIPHQRTGWTALCWIGFTLVVMLGAAAMRAFVNFGSAIPGGMDAAYYPAQTRWLMEHGRLMYDDLPLYFYILAAVTRFIMWTTGQPIADAALLASRITDTLTGPLIALPVMLLARRWSGEKWRGALGGAAAASMAVLSIAPLRMASDFQKNTLGLVWVAAAVWAMHAALIGLKEHATPRTMRLRMWALTGVFSLLAALTHVGAAGAAVLILSLCAASAILLNRRVSTRQLVLGAAGIALLASMGLGALYLADASRAQKILRAPAVLFSALPRDPMNMGPPRLAGDGIPAPEPAQAADARPDRSGPRPGNPGMRGGPPHGPGGRGEGFIPILAYASGVLGLTAVLFTRKRTLVADRAIASGCALAAMFLACPLINPEYAQRFSLMSPVPAAIAAAFALSQFAVSRRSLMWGAATVMIGGTSLVSLAHGLRSPRPPVVSPEALAELKSLAAEIHDPSRTLVVARHGLEWWAAHVLNTPVRLSRVPDDAFEKYDRVLIIQDTRPMRPPMPRGDDRFDDPALPFNREREPRRAPAGDRTPRGPGMIMQTPVPEGAALIHQGEFFRVYQLPRTDR